MFLNLLLQLLPPGSDHLIDYFPVLHQYECWHCLHSIFPCNILRCHPYFSQQGMYWTKTKQRQDKIESSYHQFIDVDFDELDILEPCSKLLDGRLHVSTRSTPRSSEVNHHLTTNHNTKLNQPSYSSTTKTKHTLLYVGIESPYETYKLVCFLRGFKTSCPLSFVVTLHNGWSLLL